MTSMPAFLSTPTMEFQVPSDFENAFSLILTAPSNREKKNLALHSLRGECSHFIQKTPNARVTAISDLCTTIFTYEQSADEKECTTLINEASEEIRLATTNVVHHAPIARQKLQEAVANFILAKSSIWRKAVVMQQLHHQSRLLVQLPASTPADTALEEVAKKSYEMLQPVLRNHRYKITISAVKFVAYAILAVLAGIITLHPSRPFPLALLNYKNRPRLS